MKYYLWGLLFFVSVMLLPLGLRPMITPDEFRYAEIPREMIESGDWVVPRLAGMDYFEKPALGYQLTAVSFKVFGYNRFALRFPPALAVGLTALFITLMLRRYTRDDRTAVLGGVLYLDFGLAYGLGNCAVLDAQVTFFITGSIAAFLAACTMEKCRLPKVILFLLAGFFAGCGFLTKGFVALAVPALTLIPFLLWEKRWKALFLWSWIPFAAAVLTALPWCAAVHRQAPDFWRYFIEVEHLQRFLKCDTVGQHAEGWWFYLALIVPLLMPGGLLLICSGCGLRGKWGALLKQPFFRCLVCWFLVPMLFFSICRGKLATYILPCFPPIAAAGALGIAEYFRSGGKYRLFRSLMTVLGGLFVLAGLICLVIGFLPLPADLPVTPALLRRFMAPGAAGLVSGLVLLYQRKQVWSRNFFAFFAGQVPVVILGLWAIAPELAGDKLPENALKNLQKFIPEDAEVFVHRVNMHGAVWVWHRVNDITLAWAEGEWDYAVHHTASGKGRYAGFEALIRRLKTPSARPAVLLISSDYLRKFAKDIPPAAEYHHDNQLTLAVYPAVKKEDR